MENQTQLLAQHLSLLGFTCVDNVSGIKGVITAVNYELYGCVQFLVARKPAKGGNLLDSLWFDVSRVTITSTTPVMTQPRFDLGYVASGFKGGSDKPLTRKV
jgi:hypothetical protein